KGCLNFKGQRRIRDSKQNGMRRYKEGEVDFFAVYFPPSSSIYVVPFGVVSGEGCLRLVPVLNGQQKLVKWAAEYTWEKHIDCLRTEMFSAKGSMSLVEQ
ncbi:MAG: endonuclease, partial [Acidobacteriota bacterium]|nr:endonuclease [Acidobacteriota bacterium]